MHAELPSTSAAAKLAAVVTDAAVYGQLALMMHYWNSLHDAACAALMMSWLNTAVLHEQLQDTHILSPSVAAVVMFIRVQYRILWDSK